MLQNRGNQIQELLCATMWMRAAPSCMAIVFKVFFIVNAFLPSRGLWISFVHCLQYAA